MNNNENNIITGGNNLNANPSSTPQVPQPQVPQPQVPQTEVPVNAGQPVLEILSPQPEYMEQTNLELPKAPINNEIPQPPSADANQQVVMQSQIPNNTVLGTQTPVMAQTQPGMTVQQQNMQTPGNGVMQSNNVADPNLQYTTPTTPSPLTGGDEELVKAYIGKNYEKITTQQFNVCAFFFSTFYMFYRKMFLYGLLVFIVNLILMNCIDESLSIAVSVLLGVFLNKLYVIEVKKRVAKLKQSNPQMSQEELKALCANKGGTSVGKIFLGFLAEMGITIVILIVMLLAGVGSILGGLVNPDNWTITTGDGNVSTEGAELLEDVEFGGYMCMNSCTVYGPNNEEYAASSEIADKINIVGDYEEYTKLNAYYKDENGKKTIIKIEVYNEATNEDISDFKDENDLRTKLGLYPVGTHTASLTLTSIGTPGFGFSDDESYTYITYTFVDDKNTEYEMKDLIYTGETQLNLAEGTKYNVTFEVKEDTFGMEYEIKSVN